MNGKLLTVCCAVALLLCGCGTRGAPATTAGAKAPPLVETPAAIAEPDSKTQVPAPRAAAISDGEMLLTYLDQVRKLPAAELAKESDQVRKLYAKTRTDVVRLRYAILLSALATSPGDDARTAELLDPVLKGTDASLRALAFLLSAQFQEQRRAHALQQKLDALMSLDKTMIERGR
jgi:hypothetical protein